MVNKHNQQGFSLFMVMIMMIVIAFLVVITSQSTSTESRLSANEADRKYALSEAEVGLRDGEHYLNEIYNTIQASRGGAASAVSAASTPVSTGMKVGWKFTVDCKTDKGLCAPVEKVELVRPEDIKYFEIINKDTNKTPAWERDNIFEAGNNSSQASSNGKAHYIIEYMGQREVVGSAGIHDYFRVTSRARGENPNTVVTLQSYVEMTRSE